MNPRKPVAAASPWRNLYLDNRTRIRAVSSVIGGFVLWEIVARYLLTNRMIIVPFSTMMVTLWNLAHTGELWKNLSASLLEFVVGFSLAMVAGIFLGFLTGTSTRAREYLEPLVSALYATPLVALIPFYIVVFGIQTASKVALVFTVAVFPILINTQAGILSVERNLLEVASSFRASRLQIFFKVQIPAAIPFVISGLRLGVGRALTGVVVAEFFFATSGIGFMISIASQNFDTAKVLLGVFIFSLAGVVAIGFLQRIEKRMAPWRPT
jgi:NitT/TauT family transport system permease protein